MAQIAHYCNYFEIEHVTVLQLISLYAYSKSGGADSMFKPAIFDRKLIERMHFMEGETQLLLMSHIRRQQLVAYYVMVAGIVLIPIRGHKSQTFPSM